MTRAPAHPQAGAWNAANALTAVRVVLVPVFGWLLLHGDGDEPGWRTAAAIAFAAAIFTDRLDGDIARRWGLVTDVGKIADPIADKALIGTALVGLSILGELAWWVTLVVLAREIGITLLRFVVLRHGVLPAGRGGKAKTVTQALALVLYVAPLAGAWHTFAVALMAVAVVLTVVTGVDYVAQALRLRARAGDERAGYDRVGAGDDRAGDDRVGAGAGAGAGDLRAAGPVAGPAAEPEAGATSGPEHSEAS